MAKRGAAKRQGKATTHPSGNTENEQVEEPEKEELEKEDEDPTWVKIVEALKADFTNQAQLESGSKKFLFGRIAEHPDKGLGVVKYCNPFVITNPELTTVTILWAASGEEETLPYQEVQPLLTPEFADFAWTPWRFLELQETKSGKPSRQLGGLCAPGGPLDPRANWRDRKAQEVAQLAKYRSEVTAKGQKQFKYPPPFPEPHRRVKQLPADAPPVEVLRTRAKALPAVSVANVYCVLGQPAPKDRLTLPPPGTQVPPRKKAKAEKKPEEAAKPKAKAGSKPAAPKAPAKREAAEKPVKAKAPTGKAVADKPPAPKPAKSPATKAAARNPGSKEGAQEGTAPKRPRAVEPLSNPSTSKKARPANWAKLLELAPLAPDEEPAVASGSAGGAAPGAAAKASKKRARAADDAEHEAPRQSAPAAAALDVCSVPAEGLLSWTGRLYPRSLCYTPGDVSLKRRIETGEGEEEAIYEVEAVVDEVTFSKGRWRKPKQRTWFLLKWKGYELNPGNGQNDKGDWEPTCNVERCEALKRWRASKPEYFTSVKDPEGL